MSRKGDCWDNAVAESFFHTLKTQLLYHINFSSRRPNKLYLAILKSTIIADEDIQPTGINLLPHMRQNGKR